MPRLQGLQERLPGQRRHGDLQGRVPLALLRGPAAAARRLFDGADPLVGAGWPPCAGAGQPADPGAGCCAAVAKAVGGIAQRAADPAIRARAPFRDWFAAVAAAEPGRRRACCSGPTRSTTTSARETAIAASQVLEAARLRRSSIPTGPLCCGRPLYDWGMLDTRQAAAAATCSIARPGDRAPARRSSGWSRPASRPSATNCRDLFPDDERASRLQQQSFLLQRIPRPSTPTGSSLPSSGGGKALVQVHCHQHAVMKPDAEEKLLDRLRARLRDPADRAAAAWRLVRFRGGEVRRVGRGRRAGAAARGARTRRPTR